MGTRRVINRKVTFAVPKAILATAELIADTRDQRLEEFVNEALVFYVEHEKHRLSKQQIIPSKDRGLVPVPAANTDESLPDQTMRSINP